MKALVIGGGGFVGSRVVRRMRCDGWRVEILRLPYPSEKPTASPVAARSNHGVREIFGDRADRRVLAEALATRPDVILDLAAYRPSHVRDLVDVLDSLGLIGPSPSGTPRIVLLSTVSVYRSFSVDHAAAETDCVLAPPGSTDYGGGKADCERVLRADPRVPTSIVRSAPIVGRGDPVSRELYFTRRLARHQPILVPATSPGRLWLVHVDDLVDALVRASLNNLPDVVVHVALEDAPTLREHVEALAHTLALPRPEWREVEPGRLVAAGFSLHAFPYALSPGVGPNVTAARTLLDWHPRPHLAAAADAVAETFDAARDAVSDRVTAATYAPYDAAAVWPGRGTVQARLCGGHPWLHEETERAWLDGEDLPAVGTDDVLQVLPYLQYQPTGTGNHRRTFVVPPLGHLISLPEPLTRQLGLAPKRPRSPTVTIPHAGRRPLVAVFEPDSWRNDRWWLFTRKGSSAYGDAPAVTRIRVASPAPWPPPRVPTGERLLVASETPSDWTALRRCYTRWQIHGSAAVDDLASWARVHLLPPPLVRDDDGFSCWARVHQVARLMRQAGIRGPAHITVRQTSPTHAAVAATGRRYLVDLGASRVLQLDGPPAVDSEKVRSVDS